MNGINYCEMRCNGTEIGVVRGSLPQNFENRDKNPIHIPSREVFGFIKIRSQWVEINLHYNVTQSVSLETQF